MFTDGLKSQGRQTFLRIHGVIAQGGGQIAVFLAMQDADRQIPDWCQQLRRVAALHLALVFSKGIVPDGEM